MNKYICGKCARSLRFDLVERLKMGEQTVKQGKNYCVNCKTIKIQKY
jgi:hypothetical protein